MYSDWKHEKEDRRYYGVTIPYEDPKAPTPLPQVAPAIQLPAPTEDFDSEEFMPNVALPRVTECERLVGQDALEKWAAETQPAREGNVPAIHRHANKVLREEADATCPNCGLIFKP